MNPPELILEDVKTEEIVEPGQKNKAEEGFALNPEELCFDASHSVADRLAALSQLEAQQMCRL